MSGGDMQVDDVGLGQGEYKESANIPSPNDCWTHIRTRFPSSTAKANTVCRTISNTVPIR